MSWAIGEDCGRDIGYGVPAVCDRPGCGAAIDRGLGYVCGGEPFGGDSGCGRFFCEKHRNFWRRGAPVCGRCSAGRPPYPPTPDVAEWVAHKLTDESWQRWRDENPEQVAAMREAPADSPNKGTASNSNGTAG